MLDWAVRHEVDLGRLALQGIFHLQDKAREARDNAATEADRNHYEAELARLSELERSLVMLSHELRDANDHVKGGNSSGKKRASETAFGC